MKRIAIVASFGLATAALAGCLSSSTSSRSDHSEAPPTITHTVHPPGTTIITTPPPPGETTPPPKQVIDRFNGSGSENTPEFTTPSEWHLSYSYDCPAGPSTFRVEERSTDGSLEPNGISIDEQGSGRGPTAIQLYDDPGTHYFSVSTDPDCHWSLAPVTGIG